MGTENAIEVRNVTKSFKVYLDKGLTLKERVIFRNRRKYENRQVLDDISFEVKKGEAVGLIGHNGCGKSTTLKLLTRIMYPDSGSIRMKGRVSSLIELGAGFHPDMSGRENIYINASIFGLTKKEIDRRLDDIIAFSELERYIENPVRTYSSGMYMRLAFAVAINVDADILLVDEILAVGDMTFQTKCFNKMREIKEHGTTIVIVSHSLDQIEQICDRTIWINDGKIAMDGRSKDVHLEYMKFMNGSRKYTKGTRHASSEDRYGNRMAEMQSLEFIDEDGQETRIVNDKKEYRLVVKYAVHESVKDAVFGFGFFRSDGMWCYGTNTRLDRLEPFDLTGEGEFTIRFPRIDLIDGHYWMDVTIETGDWMPVDYFKKAIEFDVISTMHDVGVSRIRHEWSLGGKSGAVQE